MSIGGRIYRRLSKKRATAVLGRLLPGESVIDCQTVLLHVSHAGVEGDFVLTTQRVAFRPSTGPLFLFVADLDDITGIRMLTPRSDHYQFMWAIGLRDDYFLISSGTDFPSILSASFDAHFRGQSIDPLALIHGALSGAIAGTPYMPLVKPMKDSSPIPDAIWLAANSANLSVSEEMAARCLRFTSNHSSTWSENSCAAAAMSATSAAYGIDEAQAVHIGLPAAALFGWAVASCEEQWGWARPRSTHQAANTAKFLYCRDIDSSLPALPVAVEVAYYSRRTGTPPALDDW